MSAALLLSLLIAAPAGDPPSPFAGELAALAAKCDELGLSEQAQITRHWIVPRYPGRQYLFLPSASDPFAPRGGAGERVKQWHGRFRELRAAEAERLLAAAQRASAEGRPARAFQLLHEVLRENSAQAEARRILSIEKTASLAVTQPRVAQPKLHWPAGKYWRLETPHFAIVTNHSSREAQELGRQLEELHALWRQIFFRYWSSGEALAARFAGQNEPLAQPRPKMNVVLVRDRNEYIAHLRSSVPQIEQTVGIYLHPQRTSFFFAGDASVHSIWHHEGAHQLFQESVEGTVDEPGEQRNFWVLEGAALYMESLARHEGYWTVGGCEADRLQFARYRALAGDALPLARLAAMSREEVQTSPEIGKLYGQAAGVAHFLLDAEEGKHREALIDLLTAVYRGSDASDTLATLTGATCAQLDEEFRRFLNVTDDDLAGIPGPARLRNLSLGRTAVTDKGLQHLADCTQLEWLDLTATGTTDAGLKSLAGATKLRQLFLEGTKITDASLPLVASFKQLEELDLSQVAITDEGLSALTTLRNLKVLYLTGSPVGDAALVHLRGLKQLETLETGGTQVTADGRKKLQGVLPKLDEAQP